MVRNILAPNPKAGGIHQAEFRTSPNTPGENTVTFFCFCRKLRTNANATPKANRDITRMLRDSVGVNDSLWNGALKQSRQIDEEIDEILHQNDELPLSLIKWPSFNSVETFAMSIPPHWYTGITHASWTGAQRKCCNAIVCIQNKTLTHHVVVRQIKTNNT